MSELFPQTTREYAIQRVTRALLDELPDQDRDTLAARAEGLLAIAEHFRIDFEDLLRWVHCHAPGKQWSGAEWRRWCEKYVEMRAEEAGRDNGRL